jgi:phosphatidylcholine synthase
MPAPAGSVVRLLAWLVHAYTASGSVAALLAAAAAVAGDLRQAFLWLALQVFIDSSDGVLARLVRIRDRAPLIDGTRLDDIVDYVAYVFVPALIVVTGGVVPPPGGWAVGAAMVVSSAFGFSRVDAKTADHFFTGFPSYWNIAVLYLVAMRMAPAWNAAILVGLAALVFVPVRYVYPSRTPVWRAATVALGSVWGVLMVAVIMRLPDVPRGLLWAALVFPAYYFALSLALTLRGAGRSGRLPGQRRP